MSEPITVTLRCLHERSDPALAVRTSKRAADEIERLERELADAIRERDEARGERDLCRALVSANGVSTLYAERDEAIREREEERAIVDRVWKALGIATYEQAGGKAIDEIVAARGVYAVSRAEALRACRAACTKIIQQDGGIIGGVDFHALAKGIDAALAEPPESLEIVPLSVPAGMKLVPVEPTPEMTQASLACWHAENGGMEAAPNAIYRAMLAAAPAAPAQPEAPGIDPADIGPITVAGVVAKELEADSRHAQPKAPGVAITRYTHPIANPADEPDKGHAQGRTEFCPHCPDPALCRRKGGCEPDGGLSV